MKITRFQKIALIGAAAFVAFTFILYWLVYDVWQYSVVDVPHAGVPLYSGENLMEGHAMQAVLPAGLDRLDTITVWPHVQDIQQETVTLRVLQNGSEISGKELDASAFSEYTSYVIPIYAKVEKDAEIELAFSTKDGARGDAYLSFYCSKLDNVEYNTGLMTLDYYGVKDRDLTFYWIIMAVLFAVYAAVCVWIIDCQKKDKPNFILSLAQELRRYSYLMSRLIARDFNTKYRQSVLGVLWSVLNPLLTTLVMYIVFSTMFRNRMEHYIVYLVCGVILWNFFAESTNVGLLSITLNAPLINKVYVPRYIFPVCKIVTAFVSLMISMIPLVLVCLFSGIRATKALLLLPLPLGMLFLFACGMCLILSTGNVFFQDTKFLWSVIIMMWTYLTPLFYTENIVPARYIRLYHLNPMYQFIYFFRTLIIDGVSPQPIVYLYSILACVVPLLLGIWVFHKNESKFVLYL